MLFFHNQILAQTLYAMDAPDLSIIVLAYRSEETITGFVDSLTTSFENEEMSLEIILVGNYFQGTGDKTPEVVKSIAEMDSRVKAVVQTKKGMMGWDMKTGLQAAAGKTLAVIDGDGQMPADDVIRVYHLLKEDGLDLAKTYRRKRGDGVYRRLISLVYNFIFRLLFFGLNARDINSKPKIMTREFFEKIELVSNGWFIDAEIMILARRFHAKVGQIDTVFHRSESRASFVKPLSILEFLGNLLWYRLKEFCTKNS